MTRTRDASPSRPSALLGVYRPGRRVANLPIAPSPGNRVYRALSSNSSHRSTMAHVAGIWRGRWPQRGGRWRPYSEQTLARSRAIGSRSPCRPKESRRCSAPPRRPLAGVGVVCLPHARSLERVCRCGASSISLKQAPATNDGPHRDESAAGPTAQNSHARPCMACTRTASLLTPRSCSSLSSGTPTTTRATRIRFRQPGMLPLQRASHDERRAHPARAGDARIWRSFGYMHLWVLMLLVVWAMKRGASPARLSPAERRRASTFRCN